jgi:protein-S-isoprenylcysteine O-methyltransferase Ste14
MTSRLPQLGRRGGGWVALQLALIGAIAAAGTRGSRWPSPARAVRTIAAAASALAGLCLFAGAATRLGSQITPFPKPVEEGSLKRSGAYGLVRHPMYGGVLLIALGWALVSSPLALAPWTAAAVFLDAKRRREEAWLIEAHPDYEEYQASVRHSFVPFVW